MVITTYPPHLGHPLKEAFMAVTIFTWNTGAETRSVLERGDTLFHTFDVAPGAPPRRTSFYGFAPQAPIRAADPSLTLDDFDHGTADAFAKTAGKDLLIHCQETSTPLLVAVGDCATQGGTYAYSPLVQMNNGDALRVNVGAAFFKVKVRKVSSEASGRATLVYQEVPAAA